MRTNENDKNVDVLIIGAGPTGLTTAIALQQQGLSVRVVDRNAERTPYSKALVLHARSMEVLHDLGVMDRVLRAGRPFRALHVVAGRTELARIQFDTLDWSGAPYPMWLTIPQSSTERCLEEHLAEMGTLVERSTTARSLRDHGSHVEVELVDASGTATTTRASWVVGADGGRSDVRHTLGVGLEGRAGNDVFILADVEIESDLVDAEGYNILADDGVLLLVPMDVPRHIRIIAHMPQWSTLETPPIDAEMLQTLLDQRCPHAVRVLSVGWTSCFTPKYLIAERYRVGRVLLAGDAAHMHSPVGGQGLNTGMQDGYNLAWKLAMTHRGEASRQLLDSYESERRTMGHEMVQTVDRATQLLTLRHPVARRVRKWIGTMALSTQTVRNRMGAHVGMLHLMYPRGTAVAADSARGWFARGARPGARAPVFADRVDWTETLRGPQHVLALFLGHAERMSNEAQAMVETAKRRARGSVRVVCVSAHAKPELKNATLVADAEEKLHRAYGAREPMAVWIRPDKTVGFRSGMDGVTELESYLDGVFAR